MESFERLDLERDLGTWRRLFKESAPDFSSYRGFDLWHERIIKGDFLALRRRAKQTAYGFYQNTSSRGRSGRKLMAVAIHFEGKGEELAPRSSLGGFLIHPDLEREQVSEFGKRLLDVASSSPTIAPFNAHVSLGLSSPEAGTDPSRITFLCAAKSQQADRLFHDSELFKPVRRLHALMTPITEELKEKVLESEAESEAKGFTSRPLSFLSYKREIRIYNELVNLAMRDHPNFFPLAFEEEWEILKSAPLFLKANWFRFLMHRGREIGFCFAVPDYNPLLSSQRSDVSNLASLEMCRIAGRVPKKRARLIYSGILPEYQGQGLFKAVRHKVLAEMIRDGVKEFESSYVDEGNVASLKNVESTGGRLSHSFLLYQPSH